MAWRIVEGVRGNRSAVMLETGDEFGAGVEALFRDEYEPMHRLAYAISGSDSWAEEVVQDAFLAVADRWASLENPGGYLRVSVVNGAQKKLRGDVTRRRTENRLISGLRAEVTTESPYLVDVVDSLPERERLVVVLIYHAEMNSTEIGEAMGCPAATVRSLRKRALERLAKVVER